MNLHSTSKKNAQFASLMLLLSWSWQALALSSGTGFAISNDGYVVTNFHVVSGAKRYFVRDQLGEKYPATIARVDRANDLVLLKADFRPKATLPIGDSSKVRKGERVFTIGYPMIFLQGLEAKLTDGVISSFSGLRGEPNTFQMSVPIQPGNSGGPLVNESGQVIGVVVSKLSPLVTIDSGVFPENVNYAIKANYLAELLRSEPAVYGKLNKSAPVRESLANVAARVEPAVVLVVALEAENTPEEKPRQVRPTPAPTPAPPPAPVLTPRLAPSNPVPSVTPAPVTKRPLVKFEPRPPKLELDGAWEEISSNGAWKFYIDTDTLNTKGEFKFARTKTVYPYWVYVRYFEVDCWKERRRQVREVSFGVINKDDISENDSIGEFREFPLNDPLLTRVCNR